MIETNNKEMTLQERLLAEYRDAIRGMLNSDKFSRIENSSPKHAAIIIEEMIKKADHSFCAVAQRMNPDVWSPRMIDALTKAAMRGVVVSILVVASGELSHLETIPANLRSHIRRAASPNSIDINFAIMDAKAVRVEYDVENDRATFCVNEPEITNLAQTKFNSLYEAGTAI